MSGVYLSISAWREIFERVFTGIPGQDNVTPEWLVNPATSRRLKLDKLYPDVGIAVRFIGLTAKGQGRQSDWEAMETEQRDETREELCRQNGVRLLRIDPDDEDVVKQMDALISALAHANRTQTPSKQSRLTRERRITLLNQAYTVASDLRSRIAKAPTQVFASMAEAWRDRELGFAAAPPPSKPVTRRKTITLRSGQLVHHERFGAGEVVMLDGEGEEQKVTLRFADGQQRTFLVTLVQDKLAETA